MSATSKNTVRRILTASLIGTTIEFFDFYIYAAAAVLVFPKLFFPSLSAAAATQGSFLSFGLAFFARPVGAALFGHFGDRKGRKATLVAALMTMGPCTVAVGLLPGYASIGIWAPILLAVFRFGQGLGLGGEWGGAVLLATENAPKGKKAWYGMFPQLGAPIGFLLSTGIFLILDKQFTDAQFINFAWRIPFIASAILVFIGMYVRLKITETPDFMRVVEKNERVKLPVSDVFSKHGKAILLGTFATVTTFLLFYLLTVFALNWGIKSLHYTKDQMLIAQMISMLLFGIGIPLSAIMADRIGSAQTLIIAAVGIFVYGLVFALLFIAGSWLAMAGFMAIGMFLMGLIYGPCGTALASVFPPAVRYTGSSISFTLAGILGASLTPSLATWLAGNHGLSSVGFYLSFVAAISIAALLAVMKKMNAK